MAHSQGTMLSPPLKRDKPLLMIMDGHAMVHRAFHAISTTQSLTTRDGEDTTAVFGFSNTFLRAINDLHPTHCIIAFDTSKPTFRHEMFPEYKAQRPPTPPALRHQFDRVKQLMAAFNILRLEAPGFEADDVLGTLAREADKQGVDTVILTGDTDTLQLVSPHVRVQLFYSVQQQKVYDETEVRKRFGGLLPSAHPDFKAIKGDPSDNIPGIPGLGEKTAIKLLLQFDTLSPSTSMHRRGETSASPQPAPEKQGRVPFRAKSSPPSARTLPLPSTWTHVASGTTTGTTW